MYLRVPHQSEPDVEVERSQLVVVRWVALSQGGVVGFPGGGDLLVFARVEGGHRVSYGVRALPRHPFGRPHTGERRKGEQRSEPHARGVVSRE